MVTGYAVHRPTALLITQPIATHAAAILVVCLSLTYGCGIFKEIQKLAFRPSTSAGSLYFLCIDELPCVVSLYMQYVTECVSGCMCPDGLVLDGSGGCIPKDQCPCVHGGHFYKPGETIKVDCNTWYVIPRSLFL